MKDSFNPYHKWLGIPPEEQPPHHYRLLGVAPFERDSSLIVNAAKRRMVQVKARAGEEHAELVRRVLDEISAARVCLLNAEQRAEYDRALRLRLEGEKAAPPTVAGAIAPPSEPKSETGPPAEAAVSRFGPLWSILTFSHKVRRWQVLALVAAVIVLLGGLSILLSGTGKEGGMVQQLEPVQAQQPNASLDQGTPKEGDKAERASGQPEAAPANSQQNAVEKATAPDLGPSLVDLDRSLGDLLTPVPDSERSMDNEAKTSGAEQTEKPTAAPEPEPTQPAAPAQPKKPPVPDNASQQAAERKIREMLQKEFFAAGTPEQKAALAERLFKLGRETTGDPDARFVLFRLACGLAAEVGDLTRALGVIDAIGQHYDVDVLGMKADMLAQVVGLLQPTPSTLEAAKKVLDTAMQFVDEAIARDEYDVANRFCRAARVVARKVNAFGVLRGLTAREREIKRMEREFGKVKEALQLVAENPSNAEANLTAGRWYCFDKRAWQKGLPFLAKGADPATANPAQQDLGHPDDYKKQVELAETWWRLAENEHGSVKSAMQSRAAYWRDQAMPSLDQAIADDDYQVAGRLLQLAISIAREAGDQTLVGELTVRSQEMEKLRQEFAIIQKALDVLQKDPGNAEANLTAGSWYCFNKGDWDKGLPLLAKGSDPVLANLAARDSTPLEDPKQQLELADGWWDLAENEQGPTKSGMQSRAGYWYDQTLSKLSGLGKVRVERRLESLAVAGQPSGSRIRGVVQPGNVALASNGTTVSGAVYRPSDLIDGNTIQYDQSDGFAYGEWPCEWVITFGKVQGQRTLSSFSGKDLHKEVDAPARHAALHDVALFAWVLLDQAQGHAA